MVANELGWIHESTGKRLRDRNEHVCFSKSSDADFGTAQTAG